MRKFLHPWSCLAQVLFFPNRRRGSVKKLNHERIIAGNSCEMASLLGSCNEQYLALHDVTVAGNTAWESAHGQADSGKGPRKVPAFVRYGFGFEKTIKSNWYHTVEFIQVYPPNIAFRHIRIVPRHKDA